MACSGSPSITDWFPKVGDFASAPAIVSLGEGNLNFFAVGNDGELKLQVNAGNNWQPSPALGFFGRHPQPGPRQGRVASPRIVKGLREFLQLWNEGCAFPCRSLK